MMFDQKAFDVGRTDKREKPEPAVAPKVAAPAPAPEDFPIEETEYGDDMTVTLAFEPADIKRLSTTRIDALLVNDSNYFLTWQLLKRDAESGWTIVARGESAPNEVVTFGSYTQATIGEFERFVFQAIACKQDKPFEIKTPLSVSRKLDLTKFFKVHCFRPGAYFETPVIEVPLIAEKSRKK